MRTKNNPVEIKGQKEGLWIFLDDQVDIQDVFAALDEKFSTSDKFFRGAEVTIDSGTRELSPEEHEELRQILEVDYALRIKDITSHPEEQKQIVEEVSQESSDETEKNQRHSPDEDDAAEEETDDDEFMKFLDETFRIPVKRQWEQRETYSSDYLYENEEAAFYFRGTVRSGQTLEFPGNIVILGDVNAGAYVIASGDIIVMGRLHGVVHAGAEGEERAVVIGANFRPSQLRIAQYIGRPPDEHPRSRVKRPQTEKAYVKDGAIVIEPIL